MLSALMLSIAAGLLSVLVGLTLAYYADLPPGGTIVLVAAGFVLAATLTSRVRPRSSGA
jgi:zinc transport system permease protein